MRALRPWLPVPVIHESLSIVQEGMERLQPRKTEHGQGPALSPGFYRPAKIGDLEVLS